MPRNINVRALIFLALISTALISSLSYAGNYQAVRIVTPEPETTIHDNNGNLAVTVAVSPPLHAGAGDRLVLLLDDKVVARGTERQFVLKGIDRGSHTLNAQVISADGKLLAASPQVIFHMWQASLLFRNRHELK
jgi:hypothetical protein